MEMKQGGPIYRIILICFASIGFLSVCTTQDVATVPAMTNTKKPVPVPGCHPSRCRLPNCLCAGKSIPGGLSAQDTPQMVVFTFDDAVNERVMDAFLDLFTPDRKNPNGCPISMTLFVSHQYTNYCMAGELWKNGHEMASHSITHRLPVSYWRNAPARDYDMEINDQKYNIAKLGGIDEKTIKGYRSPFLQPGGDTQFTILQQRGFLYDASLLVNVDRSAAIYWPYTLDFPYQINCEVSPCTGQPFPGLWEVSLQPMVTTNGQRCAFWDKCPSEPTSVEEIYQNILENFQRSYDKNRAPLLLNIHAEWFTDNKYSLSAFRRFLDDYSGKQDVWFVTVSQALDWIRNPTPLSGLGNFAPWQCRNQRVGGSCMPIRALPGRNRTKKSRYQSYYSTLQDEDTAVNKRLNDGGVGVLALTMFLFTGAYIYIAVNESEK